MDEGPCLPTRLVKWTSGSEVAKIACRERGYWIEVEDSEERYFRVVLVLEEKKQASVRFGRSWELA